MKIYTSYFANLKNIPKNLIPISISLYPPKGWTGLKYPPLYPTSVMLHEVKSTGNQKKYILDYKHQILDNLDPEHVLMEITELSNHQDCVLLCYEKPTEGFYCHRQLAAKFLNISEWVNQSDLHDHMHVHACDPNESPLF